MNELDLAQAFQSAVHDFNSMGLVISGPPSFVQSKNEIDGVRSEYNLDGHKVQFHFWAAPKFPDNFLDAIQKALRAFPANDVVVEYVPEVESWYTHVADLPLEASAELAEQLIKKIATAARNG